MVCIFFLITKFFWKHWCNTQKKNWVFVLQKRQVIEKPLILKISPKNLICVFLISVAPECKKSQRIIYGAAFKSEVMVNCYVEANPMPHSFKWQFKTASKRRRTDLINTVGGAKALDDIKDNILIYPPTSIHWNMATAG